MANRFLGDPDPTTAWAKAAVEGKLFTCGELVRYAAERHLRDIRDGERRGIFWRPEKAAHFLNFLPSVLQVTDGPAAGEPFYPLEYHTFCGGSLFGWRTATDRWRYRTGWLETGKGQAKSPLMGAIGVYIMGWCDIPRAQCYAIGEDRATANVLSHDELVELRSLENADKKRKGVLTAIEAALEALATATYDDPNAPADDGNADATDDGTATIDPMAVAEDVAPVAEDLRPVTEETPVPTPEPAPTVEHHHPAVDSDFRAGTTEVMNRIDFNDPYQAGRQVVEAALAPSSEG